MINFLKYSKIYLFISLTVIAIGVYSIVQWGYTYSIDFVGGTNIEYQFDKNISKEQVQHVLKEQNIEVIDVRKEGKVLLIRTKTLDEQKQRQLFTSVQQKFDPKVTLLRSETVGPTIGKEAMRKTAVAATIAMLGILLYITYAFRNVNFALSAILALVHDILVVLGTYSLISHFYGAEFDTLFVTALLTTMSFSVHDTIVVFDQIRDYKKKMGDNDIAFLANKALTETMVRSLNNSMTIIFMLLALVLLGGTSIRFFAVALLIGTITGTYSSPFVATPIAVWLEKRKIKNQK